MNFATYSSFPHLSKGRRYNVPSKDIRDCFQRDRDRIIHSVAFRKLEYKTQVFVNYEGDYYRTRLTHSLEVAQVARSIARALSINEDLTEAIALAHDLGHPPFGHTGEDGLQEVTGNLIKFEHNVQALRILTELEKRYPNFDGLNLSWEMLDGMAKHNGPIKNPNFLMKKYDAIYNFELNVFASAEAQVAAISDDIAYNAHDLDDGIKSKIISLEQLEDLPIINQIFYEVREEFKGINGNLLLKETLRRLVAIFVKDVLSEAKKNIKDLNIKTLDDIKNAGMKIIDFSTKIKKSADDIHIFLLENLYTDYRVVRARNKGKRIVKDLFNMFFKDNNTLPTEWALTLKGKDDLEKSIIICDFISGMTDRFAIKEHERVLDPYTLLSSNYPY